MSFLQGIAQYAEHLVTNSSMRDWGLIAFVLVFIGYFFLRKVDG